MLNQYIRTEKFEVEQTHVVKATRTCDICHKKELEEKCIEAIKDLPYGM